MHIIKREAISAATSARPPVGSKRPATNGEGSPPRILWGIFTRKERWGLAWRGWLVLVIAVAVGGTSLILTVYPFLAVTHRVNSNILVVEGWIHEYAIRAAVEEFQGGSYQWAFTTGGPVEGTGGYINDYKTSASVGAELLKKYGLPNESLEMVPSRVMNRDRTYGSAVALRNWFHDHDMRTNGINIVTENTHARRTRLLFEEALGHHVAVGIIAVRNPDYDPKHWWRYSEGLKDVVSESFAYVYAKFFFYLSEAPDHGNTAGTPQVSR